MSKTFVGTHVKLAIALAAMGPHTASAVTRATDDALAPLDTLLRQAAILQQAPLSRAHYQTPIDSTAPADPDALYVQYVVSEFEQLASRETQAYTARQHLSVSGGDYQLSPQWASGIRLGVLEQTLNTDDNRTTLQHDANLGSVYTQWFKNGFTAGAVLGYAEGEVDTFYVNGYDNMHFTVDTEQALLSLWGRYAFEKNGWIYGPFSRLDASKAMLSDITEQGDGYTSVIEERDVNSSVFSMGIHAAYVFEVNRGKLQPYFTLATRKQLREKREAINSTSDFVIMTDSEPMFLNIAETQHLSPEDVRWHELTCGLTIQLDKRLQITTEAEQALDLYQQNQQRWSIRADWFFP